MKILVTGATGFVGRAIVGELIINKRENWEIHTLGRQFKTISALPNYLSVDITDSEGFSALENLENPAVVIHSAGLAHQFQNSEKKNFLQVNVEGTKNILEFAARKSVGHFILISSVSVYGFKGQGKENLKKIYEEEPCFPKDEYAESKLKAEEEAIRICRESKIALTILRLATVVGEGDRGNVSRLIKAIERKRFIMTGKGANYKTLIYKKDVARACRIILEKKDFLQKEAEIFNLAAKPVQMRYIVETISSALGKKRPRFYLPSIIVKTPLKIISTLIPWKKIKSFTETLDKWTSNEIFAAEKIKQKYSFEPETAGLEAINREAVFYKTNQKC